MNLLLVGCLVFGVLCDLLFYGKRLGVSYPIAVLVFYLLFSLYNRDKIKKVPLFAWFLSIPILLLSATYALYTNMLFTVLNFMIIPVLICAQTVLLTGSNVFSWNSILFAIDIISAFTLKLFGSLSKPFLAVKGLFNKKGGGKRAEIIGKILLGLLVSLPVLLIIIGLLASSDMMFEYHFRQFQQIFSSINIGEFIGRLILVFVLSLLCFSYIFGVGIKRDWNCESIGKGLNPKIIDPVTALTFLSVVNIIYLLFTIVQFSYLFGGSSGNLPAGMNYSEYARRGFFELVAVSFINLGIILTLITFLKSAGKAVESAVKVMKTLLLLFTVVTLVSAHIRMSLYEDAYGFTYLRLLTHMFMAFLMLLIIVTLCRVWYSKMKLPGYYIVIALISYTIINFVNIDAFIAARNIERYYKTGKIDAYYLSTLSYEAMPHAIDVLDDLPEEDAEMLAASLEEKIHALENIDAWQSFNLSRSKAKKLYKRLP